MSTESEVMSALNISRLTMMTFLRTRIDGRLRIEVSRKRKSRGCRSSVADRSARVKSSSRCRPFTPTSTHRRHSLALSLSGSRCDASNSSGPLLSSDRVDEVTEGGKSSDEEEESERVGRRGERSRQRQPTPAGGDDAVAEEDGEDEDDMPRRRGAIPAAAEPSERRADKEARVERKEAVEAVEVRGEGVEREETAVGRRVKRRRGPSDEWLSEEGGSALLMRAAELATRIAATPPALRANVDSARTSVPLGMRRAAAA